MDKIEQFLSFEEEYRLFDLEYKGIYYWHLIRFNIYSQILFSENVLDAHPDFTNKSFCQKLGFIPHIPAQIKHYFSSRKYDILLSAPFIEKNINGRLIDPFTQFMIDSYNYKFNRNTLFAGNWKKKCPFGHNNALLCALLIPSMIASKLVTGDFIKKHKQHIFEIINSLNVLFSTNLNPIEVLKLIERSITVFSIINAYYKHIIKNKYCCIFISCHYDTWQFALTAAARECNIPTIEHQHGVIGKYHIAYNFKDTRDVGKYFPDYLLSFGDYWSETCHPPDSVQIISVGSPQMDASKEELRENIKDDKVIVFISNGLIGSEMSKFAISFADIAVPLGYRILYKFHPNERLTWRQRYPWLAQSNTIEPIDAPINVHDILSTARHVVGVSSTVIFEALAFGCNGYCWNKRNKEYMEDFINWGIVPLFKTTEELFELIQNVKPFDNKEIKDSLYLPNSIVNIENTLKEIIGLSKNDLI